MDGRVSGIAAADLYEMAGYVHRYARRWAVGQSPNPEDAVIYDASVAVLSAYCTPRRLGSKNTPTARNDRYIRYGAEPITNAFTIPIAVEDAIVALHRYARRYTNGRGSFTAAIVNSTAHDLLDAGISLAETQELDGTVWAADGANGQHDGLTAEQRAEALGVLPGKTSQSDCRSETAQYAAWNY